jgi:hypothetical protein
MSTSEFRGEEVKNESSWAGPARILFITLILAAGFVYYYFGPSVSDIQGNTPKASTSHELVTVAVAGETFSIPQNYTQFTKTRRGGVQDIVDLYAILPDFEGFTIAHQDDFEGDSENSPIVHFSLVDLSVAGKDIGEQPMTQRMTEREKFERIYLPLVVDPKGEPARYGFTHYRLSDKWGQKDEDLFVHEASDGGIILFLCLQEVSTMPVPWCRRDTMLTDRLELSYRFKRSRLSDWRDIDRGISKLIEDFHKGPVTAAPAPTPPAANPAPSQPTTAQAPARQPPAGSSTAQTNQQPGDFKLVPKGAPDESAPAPAPNNQRGAHKVDPNAEPDTDTDTVPETEHGKTAPPGKAKPNSGPGGD